MGIKFNYLDEKVPWSIIILNDCHFCKKTIKFFKDRGFKIVYKNIKEIKYHKKKDNNDEKEYVIVYTLPDQKSQDYIEDILNNKNTFPIILEKNKLYGGLNELLEDFSDPF